MSKGSAFVTVRVDFDGDYLHPDTRVTYVQDWIESGLEDRDDVVNWQFVGDSHTKNHPFQESMQWFNEMYGLCGDCGLEDDHPVHQED